MGQQQILFLLLGVCIIGVSIAVALIGIQGEGSPKSYEEIEHELQWIALRAQGYYMRPVELGGGGGSFFRLVANPGQMRKLITPRSLAAEYFLHPLNPYKLQVTAVGFDVGTNPQLPIRLQMTVWPESTAIVVVN
jgi:hypothetical protein